MEDLSEKPLYVFDRWEIPTEPVRRFTVDEYHRLLKLGFFAEDESFELLEGWIVPKIRKSPIHCFISEFLNRHLQRTLPEAWRLCCCSPITLADSEPEPDHSVLRGPHSRFAERHPHAEDALVVIEIADGCLPRVRGIKRRIYARAGIATYWVVDVEAECVEVYTKPEQSLASYRYRDQFRVRDCVTIMSQGERLTEVHVSDLFPA